MYTNTITAEERYSHAQVRNAIRQEDERKRETLLRKVVQKSLGLILIGMSFLFPILLEGDATVSLVTFPLGAYALFTKEDILN